MKNAALALSPRPACSVRLAYFVAAIVLLIGWQAPEGCVWDHQSDLWHYAQLSAHLLRGQRPYQDFALEYPPLSLFSFTLPRLALLGASGELPALCPCLSGCQRAADAVPGPDIAPGHADLGEGGRDAAPSAGTAPVPAGRPGRLRFHDPALAVRPVPDAADGPGLCRRSEQAAASGGRLARPGNCRANFTRQFCCRCSPCIIWSAGSAAG